MTTNPQTRRKIKTRCILALLLAFAAVIPAPGLRASEKNLITLITDCEWRRDGFVLKFYPDFTWEEKRPGGRVVPAIWEPEGDNRFITGRHTYVIEDNGRQLCRIGTDPLEIWVRADTTPGRMSPPPPDHSAHILTPPPPPPRASTAPAFSAPARAPFSSTLSPPPATAPCPSQPTTSPPD